MTPNIKNIFLQLVVFIQLDRFYGDNDCAASSQVTLPYPFPEGMTCLVKIINTLL